MIFPPFLAGAHTSCCLGQNIVKAAQHMYKTVDDELKKGKKALRSTEAIVASTVYIACRDEGCVSSLTLWPICFLCCDVTSRAVT